MGLKAVNFINFIHRSLNKSVKRLIFLALAAILSITVFFSLYNISSSTAKTDILNSHHENFNSIIQKMNVKYNPEIDYPYSENFKEKDTIKEFFANSLGSYIDRCPTVGTDTNDVKNWPYVSKKALESNCLVVNPKIKKQLTEKHESLISTLVKESDSTFQYPGKDLYHGDGIVLVGGGSYSLMGFSVIKTIRASGTTLPIEILIPTDEDAVNDVKFCELIEEYNGKCIYLNRIFSQKLLAENKFKGFQYKSLALFASSFENVLLLDVDDYPLKNLNDIFKHKVFTENGLILWPDFWKRTTNPFFYESASVEVDLKNKLRNGLDSVSNLAKEFRQDEKPDEAPYHDFAGAIPDPSSETGQMMLNKKQHWKTLLLSLYYNIYGPNVFYHLLSQYSSGQGDKETFIAAAHLLDLPYYQIFTSASVDGYFTDAGDFRGLAYYQKDFRIDYEAKLKMESERSSLKDITDPILVKELYFKADSSKDHVLFAHCNMPKFHPLKMAINYEFTKNDQPFRGFTSKECLAGLDLEKEINVSYKELLCGKIDAFDYMFKETEKAIICKYIKQRLELFQREPLFT